MMAIVNSPRTSGGTNQPTTPWSELDRELRMLCRSLTRLGGWSPDAVTTFVTLPGDAEYEQALSALCRRLAEECGLAQSVRRQGAHWVVRFARPEAATRPRRGDYEFFGAYSDSRLPGLGARLREAARHLYGARLRR
ncbi:MAG: hypothetical protein U0232_29915 [Thermomicrobiales bacterium]